MITINNVLDDAEHKQHTDPDVKQWLDELKDVVYEVEDHSDEIALEVQQSKMEGESQITLEKVQDFAPSRNLFKIGQKEKLVEILETLDDLVEQRDALGQIDGIEKEPSCQKTLSTSIPNESMVGMLTRKPKWNGCYPVIQTAVTWMCLP
uniref:Putative disease resistance RPP13-like protein 1 n=1 Tax=Rhizophora mucronata TaxID=61149 RepID=A0A2P2JTP8_RHIMU